MKVKNLKKKVLALLPKSVDLTYVDRGDEFHDYAAMQRAVEENEMWPIYDSLDTSDMEYESIRNIKKELRDEVASYFDIDSDEADSIIERYEEDIEELCYDRNDSDYAGDLLMNTCDQVWFYDTGETFNGYGNSEAQFRLDRIRIKKLFGIKASTWDKSIDEVLYNASYGGKLVVYFTAGVSGLLTDEGVNAIDFSDAHFAVVNHMNGSGHDSELNGHSFSLPFVRSNLFLDKEVSYNYSFEVCGMANNWCNDTKFAIVKVEGLDVSSIPASTLNEHRAKQREYTDAYNKGGCTFGDMNVKRHRSTFYINDYPCGTKCKDCGTFWID